MISSVTNGLKVYLPVIAFRSAACGLYSVGFTTWLALRRGVVNDERMAKGEAPLEKSDGEDDKVLVWPDLVYTELIAMIVCTAINPTVRSAITIGR